MPQEEIETAQLLVEAISKSDAKKVTEILSSGFNSNINSGDGDWHRITIPLLVAVNIGVKENTSKIIKMLLDSGADVNIKDHVQFTALHRAAWNGNIPIMELLLSKGANINSQTMFGWTPLHDATLSGGVKSVVYLLEHGSCVNIADNEGRTPEKIATEYKKDEVLEVLKSWNPTKMLPDK